VRVGWVTVVLLVVAMVLVPAGPRAQWRTPWSYAGSTGPEHWGELDPEYSTCKSGEEQSPIDIQVTEKAKLPAIRFEYKSNPLKYLINNSHAIRVNYHAPGSGSFLIVGDKRYELTQFHFHRPSEEYVHGKPYDMVVHLIHVSSDGKEASVAVLLKAGKANATVQQIWEHMPMTQGQEQEIPGVEINPAGLLPSNTSFYTYIGSQTAPPCHEDVPWFVLKTPVEVSAEQIDTFAKLYPHNVRPLQPLNGRIVKESE
jgi:carbonic anhydrase